MENVHFTQKLTKLREWLPTASFIIITVVYITSAAVEALSINAEIDLLWLAALIGVSLQAVRAIVVFFGQLNPEKPDFGWSREIIAAVLAGFSIYSVYGLSQLNGWSVETTFSMCSLMAVGAVVEVMILREIKAATVQQLMNDPEAMKRLQDGAIKAARYKEFSKIVRDVESGKLKADKANLTTNHEHAQLNSLKAQTAQMKRELDLVSAARDEALREAREVSTASQDSLKTRDDLRGQVKALKAQLQDYQDANNKFHANEKALLKEATAWEAHAKEASKEATKYLKQTEQYRQEITKLRLALDSANKSTEAAAIATTADGPPTPPPAMGTKENPAPPHLRNKTFSEPKDDDFDKVTPEGDRLPAGTSFDFDF